MEWGFFDALNSREDAVVAWLVAFAVFVAATADGIGSSVAGVLRALASWKLAVLFGSAALYCAAVVAFAQERGWWHASALKETIYWFVVSGLVLVGNAVTVFPERYFHTLIRKALRGTIAVEFLVSLYVFPFAMELFVVPLISLLVMMDAIAASKPEFRAVRKLTNSMIIVIGFAILGYVVFKITTDVDAFATRENAANFLIAPAMTLAVIPLCLAFAWISRREQERLRARFRARSAFS